MTSPAGSIKPTIGGNWKMHKTPSETESTLSEMIPALSEVAAGGRVDIVISPPFTSLALAAKMLSGTGVHLAGQDCHWEEQGAFTGEVSARALAEAGCRYVIVGHSERREHFAETDRRVSRKAAMALFWDLVPIVCVGEKRDEREAGRTSLVVELQLEASLEGIRLDGRQRLLVAYEPVWAIGSGHVPAPREVEAVHRLIRNGLLATFGKDRGASLPILYGGSVTADSVGPMMDLEVVDGVLVGGASLTAAKFVPIAEKVRDAGPQGG